MAQRFNNSYRLAKLSHFILYWLVIVLLPVTFFLPSNYFLLSVPLFIILHYGGHEAVHGCLSPFSKFRKHINFISGVVGYALVGHNFIFMRWSHLAHHRYGRVSEEYTIDQKSNANTVSGFFFYYASLLGASYIYHELAGYLYPLTGDKYHILSRRFKKKYYLNQAYLLVQIFVLLANVSLFYIGGLKFLLCKMIFMIYWGLFQNVAHYGLQVGVYEHTEVAARTYRLPRLIEFFIFRGGAYHLEHHIFPNISGPKLNLPLIQDEMEKTLGFKPKLIYGICNYLIDVFKQFYGPSGGHKISKDWR